MVKNRRENVKAVYLPYNIVYGSGNIRRQRDLKQRSSWDLGEKPWQPNHQT